MNAPGAPSAVAFIPSGLSVAEVLLDARRERRDLVVAQHPAQDHDAVAPERVHVFSADHSSVPFADTLKRIVLVGSRDSATKCVCRCATEPPLYFMSPLRSTVAVASGASRAREHPLDRPQLRPGLVGQLLERRHVPHRHDQVVRLGPRVGERVLRDVPVLAAVLDRPAVVLLHVLRAEHADPAGLQGLHVLALLGRARGVQVVQRALRTSLIAHEPEGEPVLRHRLRGRHRDPVRRRRSGGKNVSPSTSASISVAQTASASGRISS